MAGPANRETTGAPLSSFQDRDAAVAAVRSEARLAHRRNADLRGEINGLYGLIHRLIGSGTRVFGGFLSNRARLLTNVANPQMLSPTINAMEAAFNEARIEETAYNVPSRTTASDTSESEDSEDEATTDCPEDESVFDEDEGFEDSDRDDASDQLVIDPDGYLASSESDTLDRD